MIPFKKPYKKVEALKSQKMKTFGNYSLPSIYCEDKVQWHGTVNGGLGK